MFVKKIFLMYLNVLAHRKNYQIYPVVHPVCTREGELYGGNVSFSFFGVTKTFS